MSSTQLLRRMPSGIVWGAVLLLSACAHAPRTGTPATAPQSIPLTAPLADAPAAAADSVAPPSAPAEAPAADPAAQPVVGVAPADYADLFDRLRAGFKLPDPASDRVPQHLDAVQQQLTWFVDNPDYLQRAFGRAELYLYHIVTELESRGMPLELALLPMIESAYEPYAYSRARALGLWQFIPNTGSRFGLKQNWWYDGRRDVIESTRAALDYLQYLHDEFNGDWLLAIAGYNCGEAAIARAVQINQQAGRPIDFWSLRLPAETRAYVPKLLAMKRLVGSPESYGLTFSHIANRPYFERVDTLGQIDLRVAAEIAGIPSEEVYELNPAFHRWATDPSGPNYLLLPPEGAQAFRTNITQLSADERLRVEHYTVHRGDSMVSVARHFRTNTQVLRELNDLPSGALVVGAELRVPDDTVALPTKVLQAAALVDGHDRHMRRPHLRVIVHRGETLWAIARRHGMDVQALALMNGLQPGDTLRTGQRLRLTVPASREVGSYDETPAPQGAHHRSVTYVVRSGDTLSRIARLFQVSVRQIVNWNQLGHTALAPGQRLLIRLARR